MFEITDFRDTLVLTLSAIPMGNDLCVALHGGERPHIGAVALSHPRPSLSNPEVTSATTSVIAVLGHKEDHLTRRVAARLASTLNMVVTVSCGIHMDGATGETIRTIKELVLGMTEDLIDEINLWRNNQEESRNMPPAPSSGKGSRT